MASRRDYHGNIRAPEFPQQLEWLNTSRQLSMSALRGKLVLLDFWTYGCINCMHILPDLKRLEQQFPDELVVIGIHSAKFSNEADSANIRRIIARYEITHPVVNDRHMAIWQQYGVRAWPTTILVDPQGRVMAAHSGEGVYDAFVNLIRGAVEQYRRENLLTSGSIPLQPVENGSGLLCFPGKVVVDIAQQKLIISDSGHNRILVVLLFSDNVTLINP